MGAVEYFYGFLMVSDAFLGTTANPRQLDMGAPQKSERTDQDEIKTILTHR